jgi:hypothetical protein
MMRLSSDEYPVDSIPAIRAALAARSGARRKSKYGVSCASERTVDGVCFDSKAEAARWCVLRAMERAGRIKDLERQVSYVLCRPYTRKDGTRCRGVTYRADFRYLEAGTNKIVVEDVKGVATEAYRIKKAFLLAQHPDLNFREVKA